jgi:hypothetical protein
MRLAGRKFLATWMGTETPLKNFLGTDSLLVRCIFLANGLVALGALAGLVVLCLKRSAFAFPAAVFPIVFPCVYYLTHASLRYRHPIDPVLLLLMAIAVHEAWIALDHWKQRLPKQPA